MANLLLQTGGIFSGNTSTVTLTDSVNPGDLIIVQVAQKEGSLGTISDGLNIYYIYSSNTNPTAPQSYNFYTVASSRLEIGQTITYTANGSPTAIGSALYIFRKAEGERFGQPIAYTSTTGATPVTSITTSIPSALAPAILIGTTSLQSLAGYNFPANSDGGAPWTGTYLDSYSGLAASFKISRSNATQTYTSSFSATTAFQTLLNFPILLDVGQASTVSNGYINPIKLISAAQAGAIAGGNIALNAATNSTSSKASAKVTIVDPISVSIQPTPTLNAKAILSDNFRFIYDLISVISAISNARINPSSIALVISPIRAQAQSNALIFTSSTMPISSIRAIGAGTGYIDPLVSGILTYNLSLFASGKPALRDSFSLVISMPTNTDVGNNAASDTNANSSFTVNYRFPLFAGSTANSFINLSPVATPFRLSINAKSGVDVISLVSFNPIAIGGVNSNSTIKTSIVASTLSSNAIADSNTFEKFNFQSRIIERVITKSNLNIAETSSIVLRVAVNAQSSGYFDPLLKPLNDLSLEIGPTKALSNANSRIAIASTFIFAAIADSTLSEKFNFQTVFTERINAKSGAAVVTFNTQNILQNSQFDLGIANWYSVGTEGYIYDGIEKTSRIVFVQGINDYSNEQYGPLGIYQTFKNFGTNKRYTISALVKNVGPVDSSREMYVGIRFDDGTIVNSIPRMVSTSDGWVTLTAEGFYSTSIINQATAYVITSTPFDNSSSDVAAVDSVILSITDTINTIPLSLKASVSSTGYFDPLLKTLDTLTIEIGPARARSNAVDRFRVIGTFSEIAIAKSNPTEKFNFQTVFKERVNAKSTAFEELNFNLAGIAKANIKSYALVDPVFGISNGVILEPLNGKASSSLNIQTALIGPLLRLTDTLNLFADSSGLERFAVSSRISPISAFAKADNRINVLFPIPLRLTVNALSSGYIDPLINSIGTSVLINLTTGEKSNAEISTYSIINPILDLTADTSARDKFVFQSRLIQSINAISNGLIIERSIQPLRLAINAQSNGYVDPLVSSIGTFSPIRLIATAKVFGQAETGIQLGLTAYDYINAGVKSNAFERLRNQYILIENVTSNTNANSRFTSVLPIGPIQAFATGSGYLDTSIGPVNSLAIRSTGIAKQNLKEYIIFESLPTTSINTKSNAADRFNFKNVVIQSVNADTNGIIIERSVMPIGATRAIAQASGYFDPFVVSQSINLILSAGGNSGAYDRISLIQTFLPIVPVAPITENQLQNISIEAGIGAWYGINNSVSIISDPVQDGSYSLLVSALNTYDEFPEGPFGARQDFIAIQDRRYTFTAYVRNTSGDSPRNMYLAIKWKDNRVSTGVAVPVASGDGWVQLKLDCIGAINGQATAYILTSTPFNSISGDTAVIDNVSLTITDTESTLPYLGISVKSNANSRVTLVNNSISLKAATTTNANITTSSVMPLGVNSAFATAIVDAIISRNIILSLSANAKSQGRFPVSIYLVGVAQSNAFEKFVFNYILPMQVTTTSSGFIPPILEGREISLTPQIVNAKAGANEKLSLLMQLVADQPEQFEDVNLVRDADFNLGSFYWSGVTNGVEFTSEDSYDGGKSLVLKYKDFSDPDSLLPIAATQDFVALTGRDYTFSAWVKNAVGGPRTMQLKIVYSTGISEGALVTVAPEDGWVKLSLTATAKNSGPATMYIVGSYAYKFFSTDVTLVDTVSLVVANAPAKIISARVKSNGFDRFVVQRSISMSASADSNGSDRFVASYRISPICALSTTDADLISTQYITLEPLRGVARVSGEPGISIPATIKPPTPGSADETLSIIAKPNLTVRLRHENILDGTSAGSNTNAFNISIRQVSKISPVQAFATSEAYLSLDDIQNTTLRPIAAIGNSRLDVQSSVTFDLQALNAIAQVGSKQGFGISTELVPADRINLFENPSFENGTKYWTGLSSFMYTTPEYSVDGGNSALIFDNDWGSSGVSQDFNAYAGGNYSFSAYVRNISGLSPRTMYLQITWADRTNSISEVISVAQEDGWVRLRLVTQAGREKTGVATARIVVSDGLLETNVVSAIDAATLTVDSFIPDYFETAPATGTRLEATSGGQINPRFNNRLILSANIQSNAGFYQDARSIINNTMFELGTRFWTGLNNNVDITTDYVYEGTQAALVSRLDTLDDFPIGPLGISQDTYFYAGRTYTFAGYVKNIAGAEPRAMYAQLRWSNESATGEIKYVSVNDNWTRVEVTATPTVTGWASVQIITTSPFDGLITSDIAAVDFVSITETNVRMQIIRISPISGGMKSTGYVDPVVSTIATFSPSSNAIAQDGGSIILRVISDLSGSLAVSDTNANSRVASTMPIGPIRSQAKSVGQGFFDTFNAGLIIPQFSRGYAKVGGDAIVSVEFLPTSIAPIKVNATSALSVEYAISGDALIKSNAGGFRGKSSDPGVITQLIPYEINLNLLTKSNGQIFTSFGGNVGDFIGWGQPL